jgi:hypothetical protein
MLLSITAYSRHIQTLIMASSPVTTSTIPIVDDAKNMHRIIISMTETNMSIIGRIRKLPAASLSPVRSLFIAAIYAVAMRKSAIGKGRILKVIT